MQSSLEQHYALKFSVKFGKSSPGTVEIILPVVQGLQGRRESVEDEQRSVVKDR